MFWLRAYGNDDKSGLGTDEQSAERNCQLRDIAAALGVAVEGSSPEEIAGTITRKLGANGKPFRWVVDDLPTGIDASALREWFAPCPLGSTLVTTRSQEHDAIGRPVQLDALDPEDAYEALQRGEAANCPFARGGS